jgi:hypothetical protein
MSKEEKAEQLESMVYQVREAKVEKVVLGILGKNEPEIDIGALQTVKGEVQLPLRTQML